MSSTIQINSTKNMTAEQKLDEISYPIENLELFLKSLTKMTVDDYLDDDDFTSIINIIHHQVVEINKAIKN